MKRTQKWAALAVMLVAPVALAQEKVKIEQRYPAGHYKMVNTQTQKMNMSMNGNPMGTNTTKMTMVMDQVVSEPDSSGTQTMKLTYEKVRQEMSMMGQNMVYDSSDKSTWNSPMAAGFKPLIGKTITATIKDGEIVKVKGMDKIWDEMARTVPGGGQIAKQMKESLGNDAMRSLMGMGGEMLPDKAVAAGDTWQTKQELPFPMLGKISMTFFCKLKDVSNDVADISYTGKMKIDPEKAKFPVPNAKIEKVDGDYTGTVQYSTQSGRLLSQTMDMDMKMNMTIEQGRQKMRMAMDGDVKQEVKITEVTD